MTTIKLKGGKELDAFLAAFPANVQKNALRSAMRAGAVVIQKEAKTRVADETGELEKTIKVDTKSKDGTITARVKLRGRGSYRGLFMEYGVLPHIISVADGAGAMKIGRQYVAGPVEHPGHASRPFMRPALEARAKEAIDAVGEQLRAYLKKNNGFSAPLLTAADDE